MMLPACSSLRSRRPECKHVAGLRLGEAAPAELGVQPALFRMKWAAIAEPAAAPAHPEPSLSGSTIFRSCPSPIQCEISPEGINRLGIDGLIVPA